MLQLIIGGMKTMNTKQWTFYRYQNQQVTNRLQQPSLSAFGVVHNTFNRQPEPDPPLSALFQPPAPSQPMHMTYVPPNHHPASTQVFRYFFVIQLFSA